MSTTLVKRPSDLLRQLFSRELGNWLDPWFEGDMAPYREGFLPPVDVFHDDEKVTVRVEVPGVKKEDLDVQTEGDLLTISGRKEHVESRNYHQIESRCGAFSRVITVPHTVDRNRISALYENGVLTLTLPLVPEAKPKQINVEIK